MSGADFLDSNVFIYLFDDADTRKQAIAEQLITEALASANACISFQVVQETLNVLTRKAAKPLTPEMAKTLMQRSLLPFWRVMPSAALYSKALELQSRLKFSFYDSLIVAAALESGCTRLYSEDLQHGQKIEQLTIENPFRD